MDGTYVQHLKNASVADFSKCCSAAAAGDRGKRGKQTKDLWHVSELLTTICRKSVVSVGACYWVEQLETYDCWSTIQRTKMLYLSNKMR